MNTVKKWLSLVILLIPCETLQLTAQDLFIHPFSILDKMGTTASVQNDAVGSFINPALGATMPVRSNQFDLWAIADTKELTDITQWGYFYADPGLLAGANVLSLSDNSTQIDLHFGLSGGNRSIAFGISNVSLFNEDHSTYDYFHAFQIGLLLRPIPQTSLGITITQNYTSSNWNLLLDGGLRPFGTNRVTLFGAWSAQNSYTDPDAQKWLAGLSFVPVRGLEVYGKYLSSKAVTLGLNIRYGNLGLGSSLASSQEDFSGSLQSGAGISFTTNKTGFAMTSSTTPKYYVELALENLSASSDIFNPSASLFEVLNTIALAKKDPSVGGIILNTSSLYASRSDLWELRKALEDFKTSGKKIIAFIERPDFDMYALVTVADRIVMDSQGTLNFDGYVVGRGYFKHTLEKLGVGFRELRYLTYKSAAESYSRDSFSPADREQYDAYLDSIFAATKASIITDRKISEEQFNTLLDNNFLISPQEAKKFNLVDYLGREDAIERAINELSKNEMMIQVYGDMRLSLFQKNTNVLIATAAAYKAPSIQQDVWSEPPHIAIVYANGSTSLDGGMNARLLAKIIDQLGNDNKVKGIILRVNSPGGDAIAADYVAEAVKKAKERKPVYVSMGSVAGSGGYWVSMFGSKIYATPYTITGSIGVIASWFYDAGLNDKLGLSIDLIKRGRHADLQAGLLLPYRDLNAQEIEEYHQWILELYDDFVSKVAEGRNMSKDRVEHLAQGRIYAGNDAVNNGLIDGIQNLTSVVHELKAALQLPEDVEVVIDEYPYPNPFAAFLAMINQTTLPKNNLTLHMMKLIEALQIPSFTPLSMYSFSEIVSSRVASNGTVQACMPLETLEVLQGDILKESGLFREKR